MFASLLAATVAVSTSGSGLPGYVLSAAERGESIFVGRVVDVNGTCEYLIRPERAIKSALPTSDIRARECGGRLSSRRVPWEPLPSMNVGDLVVIVTSNGRHRLAQGAYWDAGNESWYNTTVADRIVHFEKALGLFVPDVERHTKSEKVRELLESRDPVLVGVALHFLYHRSGRDLDGNIFGIALVSAIKQVDETLRKNAIKLARELAAGGRNTKAPVAAEIKRRLQRLSEK